MEKRMYTAGEIAKLAGVSIKTIRFYDAKGLLKPVTYSEAGYRYYDKSSVAILQKILMLKYLGFSLQQIEGMTKSDSDLSFEVQLSRQKELLRQRKNNLKSFSKPLKLWTKAMNLSDGIT